MTIWRAVPDASFNPSELKLGMDGRHDATERALQPARDQNVVAERTPIEGNIGRLIDEIKGKVAPSNEVELPSAQVERLARATRAAIDLNTDVLAAASMDPADLRDPIEETLEQGRPERVRRLAPVIIARLAELSSQKVEHANDYGTLAVTAYQSWRKQNPSRAVRLRNARERLARVEPEEDRKYVRARQAFRFGVHANRIQL